MNVCFTAQIVMNISFPVGYPQAVNRPAPVEDLAAAPLRRPTATPPETWDAVVQGGKPVLLLDFDGTVCVGDEPVWAYADAVVTVLRTDGVQNVDAISDELNSRLSDYLDGKPGQPTFVDGYMAVATLTENIADSAQRDRAYHLSRAALAQGTITVAAPPGLAELLAELENVVWRVLATNAPAAGVASTLTTIGLDTAVDVLITDVGKPGGWAAILPRLLAGRDPRTVLSVGDIWRNDLAEPLAAGAATALIDRFGHQSGPAAVTGPDFAALYPAIRAWAADPVDFAVAHPVSIPAHRP